MREISITIPVYNEQENLMLLHEQILRTMESNGLKFEIILINDGSTDNSAAVIDHIAQKDNRVKCIHFTRNFGQTAAMMAGFDFAKGDVIIPMDADLQNNPEDIPRLLEKIEEGYDVCSGWRNNRKDAPIRRTLVSRMANKLISMITGVRLRDYGCTLKAYKKNVIKGVRLYGEMHRFIPIYASWEGAMISEIPVKHTPRKFGKSSYGLERTFKVLLDLIVITFLDNYAQKPIYVFGGFGFLSFAASFLVFLYASYLKVWEGISFIQTPLPLIATMAFVTGLICVLMGLLAEMIMRPITSPSRKRFIWLSEK
jgi:glycosyltransferase involved in cell wall biosynthesis